ncbi:MAG: SDR family oxidoreductase [Planctomycetota bacterium]
MSQLRVLVTGASRGIGRAIALRFAREGAKVVVAARSSDALDTVVAEIEAAGGEGLAAPMNVVDHGSVEAAVYRALQFTGGALDVLVNNAGAFELSPFERMNPQAWTRILDVNLNGPFLVTLEALEGLEESERAHVFNICSDAGRQGYERATAYCASKYGLRGFGDALRKDLSGQGVRVTTVFPRATDTDIFKGVEGDFDRSKMDPPEAVADVIWSAYQSGDVDEVEVTG